MTLSRWIGLLLGLGLLAWLGRTLGSYEGLWLAKVASFVVFLPWLAAAVAVSPAELLKTLRDDRAGTTLQRLGSLTFAAGAVVGILALAATFNEIAHTGGQANPAELLRGFGRMFVPLLFGLGLRFFVYDVLAAGLERAGREAT